MPVVGFHSTRRAGLKQSLCWPYITSCCFCTTQINSRVSRWTYVSISWSSCEHRNNHAFKKMFDWWPEQLQCSETCYCFRLCFLQRSRELLSRCGIVNEQPWTLLPLAWWGASLPQERLIRSSSVWGCTVDLLMAKSGKVFVDWKTFLISTCNFKKRRLPSIHYGYIF